MAHLQHNRKSVSLLQQDIPSEVLAHLPASFRVLAEFALKEGEKDANAPKLT